MTFAELPDPQLCDLVQSNAPCARPRMRDLGQGYLVSSKTRPHAQWTVRALTVLLIIIVVLLNKGAGIQLYEKILHSHEIQSQILTDICTQTLATMQ